MSLVIFIMAWMDRQLRGFFFCVCLLVLTLCVEALFVHTQSFTSHLVGPSDFYETNRNGME